MHPLSTLLGFEENDMDAMYFDFDFPDRPETPTPPSRSNHLSDSLLDSVDDTGNGVLVAPLGRTPACINTMLKFAQIYADIGQLALRSGIPFQRVFNRFTRQFGRTCGTNYWNIYERFHAANKEQELARLG